MAWLDSSATEPLMAIPRSSDDRIESHGCSHRLKVIEPEDETDEAVAARSSTCFVDDGVDGAPNGISVPRWSLSKPHLKRSRPWASLSGILLLSRGLVSIWRRECFRFTRSTRRARSLWRANSRVAS